MDVSKVSPDCTTLDDVVLSQRKVLANQLYELGMFAKATASYRAILHSCWSDDNGSDAAHHHQLLLVVAANHAASVLQEVQSQIAAGSRPSQWLGSVVSACAWSTCALDYCANPGWTGDDSAARTVCDGVRNGLAIHPSVATLVEPEALPKPRLRRQEHPGSAGPSPSPTQTSSLHLVGKLRYRRAKLFVFLHMALFSCGCHALLNRKREELHSGAHVVLSCAELSWLSLMAASRDAVTLSWKTSNGDVTAQNKMPADLLIAAQDLLRDVQRRLSGYDNLFSSSLSTSRDLHPHLIVLWRCDSEPNVQHGSGIVALDDIPAGSSLVVERRPLLLVGHDDTAQCGAERDDGTTAYERRFIAAIETVMRRLDALDHFSAEQARAAMSLVDRTIVQCASQSSVESGFVSGQVDLSGSASQEGILSDDKNIAASAASLVHLWGLYHAESTAAANLDGSGTTAVAAKRAEQPACDEAVDANDALLEATCDIWHRNAMRISEVDFRIADTEEEQRKAAQSRGRATPNRVGGTNAYGGSAAYLLGSRFNHSCHPNALCVFSTVEGDEEESGSGSDSADVVATVRYRGSLVVRALRFIKRGEEVTISYCPILSSPEVKEQHCRFRCSCGLCSAQRNRHGELELPPPLCAVRCPACGSFVSGSSRTRCGHRSSCPAAQTDQVLADFLVAAEKAEAAANRRLQSILEECTQRRAGDGNRPMRMRRVMQQLVQLESCMTQLAPTHWLRLRVQQEALAASVSASITVEDSLSLLDISERLLAVVEHRRSVVDGSGWSPGALLPENWPLTTGLRMARVFALCRHFIGTAAATTRESDPSPPAAEGLPPSLLYRVGEIRNLVGLSLQEHALQQFGLQSTAAPLDMSQQEQQNANIGEAAGRCFLAKDDGTVSKDSCSSFEVVNAQQRLRMRIVESFLERYRVELQAAGALRAEDLLPILLAQVK